MSIVASRRDTGSVNVTDPQTFPIRSSYNGNFTNMTYDYRQGPNEIDFASSGYTLYQNCYVETSSDIKYSQVKNKYSDICTKYTDKLFKNSLLDMRGPLANNTYAMIPSWTNDYHQSYMLDDRAIDVDTSNFNWDLLLVNLDLRSVTMLSVSQVVELGGAIMYAETINTTSATAVTDKILIIGYILFGLFIGLFEVISVVSGVLVHLDITKICMKNMS